MAEAIVSIVVQQLICATSEWLKHEISVIHDVEEELENMSMKMQTIQSVLEDAENRSMQDSTIKLWLQKLQDISYDMEDVFDEWNTRVLMQKDREISSSSSFNKFSCLSFNHFHCSKDSSFKQLGWRRDIALRIKDMNRRTNLIFSEMDRLSLISRMVGNNVLNETIYNIDSDRITTSLVVASEVHGRDDVKNLLVSKVLCEGSDELNSLQVISIVGVGGLGKTTLAQLVYNDEEVKVKFVKRMWVCVSDSFDEVKVARAILEGMGVDHNKMDLLQNLYETIQGSLSDQRILLVLDDVWDEKFEKWRRLRIALQDSGNGSTVLVTTRKEIVAIGMGTVPSNVIKPDLITDSECWSLMSHIAFLGKNEVDFEKLAGIGKEIAKKCKGLPLAARTLGGLLLSKSTEEEWTNVLESEVWELERVELELFPQLFLSYRELPPALKRCFSYLALFPKDSFVSYRQLISLWMAHGYLKPKRIKDDMMQIGQGYVRCLVSLALIEERIDIFRTWKSGASMHDIMHDFALHLAGHELLSIEQENDNTSSDPTPKKWSYPKSTKARHLFVKGRINPIAICDLGKLRSCLVTGLPQNVSIDLVKRLKVVRALYLIDCNLEQVPQDIGKLIHLRTLDLSGNSFHELPKTIGDLYNLRHLWLENSLLSSIPKSIGKLINLHDFGGNDFNCGGSCKLGWLKNLNQLGVALKINFTNDYTDEADAKEAELVRKLHLVELDCKFNDHDITSDVFEALQAPPNLQCLQISAFRGARFPSWIISLKYLTKLEVRAAVQVLSLPPLGKLQSLKELELRKLSVLKFISQEFLGIDDNTPKNFCAFPQLKKLRIEHCNELKEWEDLKLEDENTVTVMPKLHNLYIADCPMLEVLPRRLLSKLSSLKELHIPSCEENVDGVNVEHLGLKCLSIDYCNGTKLPNWVLSLNFLTKLIVDVAENVLSLPPLGILPSLEELQLQNFSVVDIIGREFLGIGDNKDTFTAFPKLVKLELRWLNKLKEWEDIKPEDEYITVMPKLQFLAIKFCSQLQVFPRQLLCKAASLKELNLYKIGGSLTETIMNDNELLLHIEKVFIDVRINQRD